MTVKNLTHLDEEGRARMVDVSAKPVQRRIARARGHIRMAPETVALIRENGIKKGDVLTVAEIAGIQAAKRTCDLIPLCHSVRIGSVQVRAHLEASGVKVDSEAVAMDKTGVEMEALTAVSVALLTVYDMCKAVDKHMAIEAIVLVDKRKEDIERE
jgi:cyclic pyranopterin monophosphate synthase